ncbi:hypothetical protein PSPTOT1_4966 [Pseudomonas syringae pv. tomato T1]|nr:hypothetical protein PSPTOT1_4966 [Pseudomonas syringae pv. tomato T1]
MMKSMARVVHGRTNAVRDPSESKLNICRHLHDDKCISYFNKYSHPLITPIKSVIPRHRNNIIATVQNRLISGTRKNNR